MTKYYAVKKGKKPGIYENWASCKAQVEGVSGAVYQKFETREDALLFIGKEPLQEQRQLQFQFSQNKICAYVDGSFDVETFCYGAGVVLLYGDQKIELCKWGTDQNLAAMRNVAGEILGALISMAWVEQHLDEFVHPQLIIYHDYEGIAKWPRGEWKAQKEGTRAYVLRYMGYRKKFPIEFVKVKAHSGDIWNERADALAKKSIEKYKEMKEKGASSDENGGFF